MRRFGGGRSPSNPVPGRPSFIPDGYRWLKYAIEGLDETALASFQGRLQSGQEPLFCLPKSGTPRKVSGDHLSNEKDWKLACQGYRVGDGYDYGDGSGYFPLFIRADVDPIDRATDKRRPGRPSLGPEIKATYIELRNAQKIDFSATKTKVYPLIRAKISGSFNVAGLGDEAIRKVIGPLFDADKVLHRNRQ